MMIMIRMKLAWSFPLIIIIIIIIRMEVALVQGGLVITIMMDGRETLFRAGAGLDDNG